MPIGPGHGRRADLEHALDFVEQLDGRAALAIELVDEGHDGRVAHAADLHQLDGSLFDTLRAVDDHERAVHRGQRAVGVFGEVLVAGRVEQVDDLPAERELHHRRRDGDAALLLERHPVGRGVTRGLAALDRAGELDRAAEQQQLFGERGLARVGMRNDGKRAPARRFMPGRSHRKSLVDRRLAEDRASGTMASSRPSGA